MDILAVDGRPTRAHASGLGICLKLAKHVAPNIMFSSFFSVDSFLISAGERIDFVPVPSVTTNNNAYYLRVRGLNDCDDTKNGVHQHALLRYDNAGSTMAANIPCLTYLNAIRNGQVSEN
jgi:hypothetical protein